MLGMKATNHAKVGNHLAGFIVLVWGGGGLSLIGVNVNGVEI